MEISRSQVDELASAFEKGWEDSSMGEQGSKHLHRGEGLRSEEPGGGHVQLRPGQGEAEVWARQTAWEWVLEHGE